MIQKRPFDEVRERTPPRGLGQPKGQGPRQPYGLVGRQPAKPGSLKLPHEAQPAPAQRPAKEYKRAEKTENLRPKGKSFANKNLYEEGSARIEAGSGRK